MYIVRASRDHAHTVKDNRDHEDKEVAIHTQAGPALTTFI